MRILTFTKTLILMSTLALTGGARADLEIIPLRHRTVEQVLPVLQPLVEPGGVLTGQNNQLFVRTSPRNLEEIRRALAAIDTPQRRLMISVRFDSSSRARDSAVDVRGTVRAGDVTLSNRRIPSSQSSVTIGAQADASALNEQVDQRIQVLEGGHAFIATGESRPIRQGIVTVTPHGRSYSQGTEFQSANTGFEVVPRVAGDRVFLDIAPQREKFGAPVDRSGARAVETQRAASTLSARLGEWFEIGGVDQSASSASHGIGSSREASAAQGRRIWVRVDEIGQ
jgi:type II secretory pathway component GspD/PulD (secretin)